jgi:hypothetical protein
MVTKPTMLQRNLRRLDFSTSRTSRMENIGHFPNFSVAATIAKALMSSFRPSMRSYAVVEMMIDLSIRSHQDRIPH